MGKVLLLTDFSEASRHALTFARSFFKGFTTDFHLLCTSPAQPVAVDPGRLFPPTIYTAFIQQLQTLLADLRGGATSDLHTFCCITRPGNVIEVINRVLQEELYDYVVVGTRKKAIAALAGESMLIRRPDATVLAVPVRVVIRPIRQIVLALDLSQPQQAKRLAPVIAMTASHNASLTLLVIDTPRKWNVSPTPERCIRAWLLPIEPTIVYWQAPTFLQGITTFGTSHPADLLVAVFHRKHRREVLRSKKTVDSGSSGLSVPLLALYDDGLPQPDRLDGLPTGVNRDKIKG